MICGITSISSGSIAILGHDVVTDFRAARSAVGLVPQEVKLDIFAKVQATVRYTRALFGKPPDEAWLEELLRKLSLWDKRESRVQELSGGMMRRVLIAKALSHRPQVLFLDEPTAGVDVELRKSMWDVVRDLRAAGTTIILTTHYIEEAEAMADRIAVINGGRILLVEEKAALMRRMGRKRMTIELQCPVEAIPEALARYNLARLDGGASLEYAYDTSAERTGIASLLRDMSTAGIVLKDVQTRQDSLEDIFVGLVREQA
jgi:ABC-2 type transport system ATP-binding protein